MHPRDKPPIVGRSEVVGPVILRTSNRLHRSHLCERSGLCQCSGDDNNNTPGESLRATIVKDCAQISVYLISDRRADVRFVWRRGRVVQAHCLPTRHESEGEEKYLGEIE